MAHRPSSVDSLVLERAHELASVAAGLGDADRRARISDAESAVALAEIAHDEAMSDCSSAEQLLRSREPTDRPRHATLEPAEIPPDAGTAARWAVERQGESARLAVEARSLRVETSRHEQERQAAETEARLVASAVTALPSTDEGSEADGEHAWDGPADEAARIAHVARARLDETTGAVADAQHAFERAGMEVRTLANDPGISTVGGVRLALVEEGLDSLAGRSGVLADELDGMLRPVEAELADVVRHREALVVRLSTLVETQLRQLGRLERPSTLPSGLGEWSGKPFLSVEFPKVDPGELPTRLAPVVDAAASDARKREPAALLFAAIRTAVVRMDGDSERTFRVRMLRPNRMMQLQWATVAELEREFSGGMKLTAAICT